MHRRTLLFALPSLLVLNGAQARTSPALPALPQDPARWINSAPLSAAALAGHPLLIEFWTFDCVNCRNTQAWMDHVNARFASAGLITLGIHTPELPFEHDPVAVRRAVAERRIAYPVVLDGDHRLWQAFDNQYWPAHYLFDANHRLVGSSIGELHRGDSRGDAVEARLEQLVAARPG
jgi:thiol-disulfide isomerase/thioredoxin